MWISGALSRMHISCDQQATLVNLTRVHSVYPMIVMSPNPPRIRVEIKSTVVKIHLFVISYLWYHLHFGPLSQGPQPRIPSKQPRMSGTKFRANSTPIIMLNSKVQVKKVYISRSKHHTYFSAWVLASLDNTLAPERSRQPASQRRSSGLHEPSSGLIAW